MRTRPILGFALALFFAACGGGDPKELTNKGHDALGSGDAKTALANFDEALAKMTANDPDYLRAAMGRCEALAKIDAPQAKASFLELAQKQSAKVKEQDYSLVCNALIRAKAFDQAVDVMDTGAKTFKDSPSMKAIQEEVKNAINKSGDSAAMTRMKNMGYTGGASDK